MTYPISEAVPFFTGIDGRALEGGKIYIGTAGSDPRTTPVTVYWDESQTIPASQPVRTSAGHPVYQGTPANFYVGASRYSIRIETSNGTFIYQNLNATASVNGSSLNVIGVNPLDYGAVGDGVADDTTALQAAINTGLSVLLPAGYTFLFTIDLTISTHFQYFGGQGKLAPDGNCGVIVTNCTGAVIECTFESASHTGTAVSVISADRVRIKRLLGIDVFNVLYVTVSNVTTLDWCWAIARGYGIKWYGADAARSDILHINFAVIDPAGTEYGLDWDGNCHSLEVKYLGLVGGKGTIIRNTSGGVTYPAIGRFGHIEQDYSTGVGIEITAGLDYDFNMPYVLGSASDGFKIAAAINDYEVRIHGGKSIGNTGYGINNAGGILLFGGSTALYSNTAGETTGDVWTMSPRFALNANAYFTMSGSDVLIGFDSTDYLAYDTTNNAARFFVGGTERFRVDANGATVSGPINLKSYTFATLPASPSAGDLAVITDSNSAVYNAAAAGGGANVVKVCYLGGSWKVA